MEISTMGIYGNISNNSQMKREYKDEMGSTLAIQQSYGSFGPFIDGLPTKKVGLSMFEPNVTDVTGMPTMEIIIP